MELSGAAYVILGAVAEKPRSGTEIKQFVETATNPFFSTGGEPYIQLGRLLEAGLIGASDAANDQNTVYNLAPAGKDALTDWVTDTKTYDMQVHDEMLGRLFFSNVVEPEKRAAIARAMSGRHRTKGESARRFRGGDNPSMHEEVLNIGLEFHDMMSQRCDDLAKRLESGSVSA